MPATESAFTLQDLARIIEDRKTTPSAGSYTNMLLQRGEVAIRNKLLEEVAELIIESGRGDQPRIAEELADVYYLTLVLASHHNVRLQEVERCLAARHSKVKPASESAFLRRLAPFHARPGNFSFSRLCKATGFETSKGADIVLFSPFLKEDSASAGKVSSNEFPQESKALKTLLEKHGLKVKMGIRARESERYVKRRSREFLPAIIFAAKPVVLPLLLKVFVDCLKDSIEHHESKAAIHFVVAAEGPIKEQTFILRGTPESVHRELEKNLFQSKQ